MPIYFANIHPEMEDELGLYRPFLGKEIEVVEPGYTFTGTLLSIDGNFNIVLSRGIIHNTKEDSRLTFKTIFVKGTYVEYIGSLE